MVAVCEVGLELTLSFVLHDHRPLGEFRRLRCVELNMHLDDLEGLQAEHGLDLLFHHLRSSLLTSERMLSSRVRLGLNNLEGPRYVKVEHHICLSLVAEGQLLDL